MISVERIKFKYNKGREGLREVKDLFDCLNTRTRPHERMSSHGPSDASEMTLYEKVLQMQVFVRGQEVLNDVTPEDAAYVGIGRILYSWQQLPESTAELPVCSGDMLFNLFDEYYGFLQ